MRHSVKDPGEPSVQPQGPPTTRSVDSGGLTSVLDRNIRALQEKRREEEDKAGLEDRIANAITRFTGTMPFVYIHMVIVALWVAVNLGVVPGVRRFDETFVILATVASVEAIFLSTFVLISQNRAAVLADRRADLDLQINLLSEHEITRLLTLVIALADHFGIKEAEDPRLAELQEHVAPEKVLDELSSDEEEGRG